MGWSVLFEDYLDTVDSALRDIKLSDLTGLIGRWMAHLSSLNDHEVVTLIQELHFLANLLSSHSFANDDSTFFNLWIEDEVNQLVNEVLAQLPSGRSSSPDSRELRTEFRFPRFGLDPKLDEPRIMIQGELKLAIIDPKTNHIVERKRQLRKPILAVPFLKSVAKHWGNVRLVDVEQ